MSPALDTIKSAEDLSNTFEAAIAKLQIFDTVKVMRWVRGDMMCHDEKVRRAVCPEQHIVPKEGDDTPPEYVYVVCVTKLVPEDRGKNGVTSYHLTIEDEKRIQPLLPEGYKLAMGGGHDSPTAGTKDTSPYNDSNVWKQDESDGRRRGDFVIETRETRLRRMQDDLKYAENSCREADYRKSLMDRIREKYGDLMKQASTEE